MEIENNVEATQRLAAIREIEKQVEEIITDRDAHVDWFNDRISKANKQIEFLASMLEKYLDRSGKKTIKLPSGQIGARTTRSPIWPDNDVLIEYSNQYGIDTKVKEVPDKTEIKRYMKESGNYPPGYDTKVSTKIYVKTSVNTSETPEAEGVLL